jgi:hypothetical protein
VGVPWDRAQWRCLGPNNLLSAMNLRALLPESYYAVFIHAITQRYSFRGINWPHSSGG